MHPAFTRGGAGPGTRTGSDLSNMNAWSLGEVVVEKPFATDASGTVSKSFQLAAGPYRALLETTDAFGKPVTAMQPITVLDPQADRLDIKIAQLVAAPSGRSNRARPSRRCGAPATKKGRAFIEVEHRGKIIQSYWTQSRVTQAAVEQASPRRCAAGSPCTSRSCARTARTSNHGKSMCPGRTSG